MEEIEREDVYRDLGYLPREEVSLVSIQRSIKAMNDTRANPDVMRVRNFEIVKQLDSTLVDTGQGTITMKILDRQIDFHLPSNTFYLHAKQLFGYGIDKQVKAILDFLEKKK